MYSTRINLSIIIHYQVKEIYMFKLNIIDGRESGHSYGEIFFSFEARQKFFLIH
jgi:hypothetical protein